MFNEVTPIKDEMMDINMLRKTMVPYKLKHALEIQYAMFDSQFRFTLLLLLL